MNVSTSRTQIIRKPSPVPEESHSGIRDFPLRLCGLLTHVNNCCWEATCQSVASQLRCLVLVKPLSGAPRCPFPYRAVAKNLAVQALRDYPAEVLTHRHSIFPSF